MTRTLTRWRTTATFAACALLLAGCSNGASDDTTEPTASPGSAGPSTGSTSGSSPSDRTEATRTPESKADELSAAQKVGQLFMTGADASSVPPESHAAITEYHVGNIMLTGRSTRGVDATREIAESLRAEVGPKTTNGVPLFVATDQEGGQVQVLQGSGFSDIPSALEQGDMSPKKLRTQAKQWGKELRAAGVDMNLAPVMDTVPSAEFASRNAPIGAFDRQYGYTPRTVARHGTAFAHGMSDAGVAAVIKHFPGLGRVTKNTDTASGVTDRETTRHDPYLEPFEAGIDAGAPFVMMSTASYPKIDEGPAAFSSKIIEGMLRGDLGFDGVVISDDLSNAEQVAKWTPAERAVKFLSAGGDMVLAVDPTQIPLMHEAVLRKYKKNEKFAAKVDASVERILAAKQ